MKKLSSIVIIVVLIFAALIVLKDVIAKAAIEQGVRFATGLPLHIGSFRFSILQAEVDIKNLRLLNPSGFTDKTMIDLPAFYLKIDRDDLLKGKIHIQTLKLHLHEFAVIKNNDGRLNLDALKAVQQKGGAKKEAPAPKPGEKPKLPPFQVDFLELHVDKASFKDYTKSKPDIKEFNLNLHEQYTNITNPYSIVSIIVVKVMMNTTIGQLANFDVGNLKGMVSDTLNNSTKIAADFANQATEMLSERSKVVTDQVNAQVGKVTGLAGDAGKEAEAKMKELTSGVSSKLGGLTESVKIPSFGKKKE